MTDERKARARGWIADGSLVIGAMLVSYGAWLCYRPAGSIVLGTLLLALGVRGSRE